MSARVFVAALIVAPVWFAGARAGTIDEVPPFPPYSGLPDLRGATACAILPRDRPASLDATTLRLYSRCAQQLAADTCRSGAGAATVARQLAARFSMSEPRVTKGLRRLNSAHASRKGWCDLTVGDYESIVSYAATGRDGVAEHREEWIRFTLGDENGVIEPGGLARAIEQRRALLREPVAERLAVAPVQEIGALPPSPGGWTNLTGYVHPVGRINDLLIHPTSTNTMWAGADGGGVWKTTDGGASWQAVDDFFGSLSIASFAMRPGDPSTIYVATGAQGSHGLPLGAGIFKTTDGGATWSQIPLTDPATYPDWASAYKITIHPGDSNTLLAATSGGAYQTTNGGASWTKLFSGQTRNVAIHPANGNLRVIAMDDGTIRVTTDGTNYNSYTIATVTSPSYTRIALAPSNQNVMYALVNNGGNTLLYRSNTTGASWTAVSMIDPVVYLYNTSYLRYTGGVWVDPTNANHIAVVEGWGYVTTDASATTPVWKDLRTGWVDFHGVVSDPGYNGTSNKIVYFMDDGGLYKWNDVDTSDTELPAYLSPNGINVTQVYSVAGRGGNVIFGAQDVSPRAYRSDGTSTRWRFMTNSANGFSIIGDGAATAADPTNPNILYGSRQFLNLWRSTDGGVTATAICGPDLTDVTCTPPNFPSTGNTAFIAPFILDPNNPSRMLAGGTSLWRSNNVSTGTPPSWTAIHTGASGVVVAIAVAPTDSNVVWVAYNNQSVYKTTNGTAATPTWTQVTNVPAGNKLRIFIDRTDANRVFIGLSGFLANRLRFTLDGGTTWNAVTGLPNASVFAIQQHPSIANWLYAGTAVGLFASEDGGTTWSTTNYGPANVQVRDLSWYSESGASGELLVGTFGRGVWRAALNPGADAGAIQFRSNASTVTEGAAGGAVLSLTRSTGAGGAVSVTYNTANGTAIAGTDYTAVVNGTVSWADGDASVKTISIPVPDNGLVQSDRTFTVTLSAPTGGAVLGAPTTATVTVTDPEQFPAQCQMPVGWFVPGTATAGWAVATDQVYERTCSLKSMPIGDGQAAEIAYTGNFTAGNITFRRKVSSEATWDFFRFYIDGVEQLSATGNMDWVNPAAAFSFPVTAGTHTIKFRYEKDANCCVSGSDAAWIDAVTLPVADAQAPTPPAGLTANAVSSSQINLSWSASNDNVAVTAYEVFRDGAFRATVSGATNFDDTGLAASTTHNYTVAACDAAGNCSAQSASVPATTLAASSASFTPLLRRGWNLLGNSLGLTLNVATIFGSPGAPVTGVTTHVNSIWKWNATLGIWQFYSPGLTAGQNQVFADDNGFEVLASIEPGLGYWVHLKNTAPVEGVTLAAQNGAPVVYEAANSATVTPAKIAGRNLVTGWQLVALADAVTPSAFNEDISGTAPQAGVVKLSFVTLWAWDALLGTWYFYAPQLHKDGVEQNVGLTLVQQYALDNGFLHFEDSNKKLGIGTGFWVRK